MQHRWIMGGGIALAFRNKYPAQFELYKAHCKAHPRSLVGTCLLIPGDTHHIACLFTSRAYGKRKDKPEEILAATKTAVQDLMKQNPDERGLHACRFNSGKFDVPWTDTEAILKELGTTMTIYTPVGEAASKVSRSHAGRLVSDGEFVPVGVWQRIASEFIYAFNTRAIGGDGRK